VVVPMPTPEVVPAPATLRRRTSPNCEVNELITPTPFEPSVITPTNPLLISIDNLVALVRVLKVAAIPVRIVEPIVDAVPILTKVSPIETTGTLVSFPVIDNELPAETPDTESTQITVPPIATVWFAEVADVRKLTFAVRTVLGAVNANATLLVI
jgi:hypothetical protein